MKKIIVLVLVSLLLSISTLGVIAASTGLDISYSRLDNGNILVYAAVVNINDPVGLCGIGYDIEYDNTVLELKNVEVNIPEKWKPFLANEMVENWSAQKSANVYNWSLLNCEFGNGIKEDHQLFVKIEFKPLVESNTVIKFKCENAVNDNVEEIDGESKNLEISFASSNQTGENQNVSANTESVQTSNAQTSNTQSGVSSNFESNTNSDTSETVNNKNDAVTNPILKDDSQVDSDKTTDSIIIVIVILAIVAGAIVAFVLYSKKGNK